jgi:hypothetical protein
MTLDFPVVSSNSKPTQLRQTQLSFAMTKSTKTQQGRLREMVIKTLGKAINDDDIKIYRVYPSMQVNAFESTKNCLKYSDVST